VDELSHDRARMDAMLAGMVEGVLVVDNAGRLELVNRAAQTMLHIEPDAIGRPYVEAVRHPDVLAQLLTALRGDDVDSRELALSRDPGRTFVARAAPVQGGGAVLVLHDVTDLRRADQIRRDFVANVSHELRTPLTAIRGYAEALMDDDLDPESRRKFLDIVSRHSARMERLVSDLLRLARLDAGQEVLDLTSCDLRQLLQTIVNDTALAAQAKRQRISSQVAPDVGPIQVDQAKLYDVIRNLVDNAVNYSPADSAIELEAVRVDQRVEIAVADSGPGIPAEDATRVFERFYRVDKSRSRPGGTGLGLSIVKHLVELHGGAAHVEPRPGGGSRFVVSLPAYERTPVTGHPAS
jgi:two-component system phosphate regulon sensor histidine kinase PhoR